uniref:Uncharacterized protein n=2 Tax=Oryza TaxID=4527 RepID=A0A0D3ELH4_9ORYZ
MQRVRAGGGGEGLQRRGADPGRHSHRPRLRVVADQGVPAVPRLRRLRRPVPEAGAEHGRCGFRQREEGPLQQQKKYKSES